MARDAKRSSLLGLTAWERHCKLMKDYQEFYGGKLPEQPRTLKTDYDSLVEQHRFIRQPEDDRGNSWEVRLARKYYSKLFKEYAIVDLSRYKLGQLGLRWRTEAEVREGKGQFLCGAKGCSEQRTLASFEVPFSYMEAGQRKQALVKVRLCPKHAIQLNYRKTQEKPNAAGSALPLKFSKRKAPELSRPAPRNCIAANIRHSEV
ncbi:hypothetical protein WJX73_003513 [Symbiochloris irregularis]|uniref:Uncharacterized protein n=1 Tax=Symbiochloris irregularis TaxID=706552 RepID=A0AAW1PZN8_9CHLO